MHEKISLVHVLLHELLVLLRIPSANDQIVLTRDEPEELLEPEHFPLHSLDLSLLQFLKVSRSCAFGLFDGRLSRSFCLIFLLVGLLLNFEILFDVELS